MFYGPFLYVVVAAPVALIALVVGRGAVRVYAVGLLGAAGVMAMSGFFVAISFVSTS